jgi:hypothetical protein
LEII